MRFILYLRIVNQKEFTNGIKNLFDIYLPIVDNAFIFDNSNGEHEHIATKVKNRPLSVLNQGKIKILKDYYDKKR